MHFWLQLIFRGKHRPNTSDSLANCLLSKWLFPKTDKCFDLFVWTNSRIDSSVAIGFADELPTDWRRQTVVERSILASSCQLIVSSEHLMTEQLDIWSIFWALLRHSINAHIDCPFDSHVCPSLTHFAERRRPKTHSECSLLNDHKWKYKSSSSDV